MPKHTSVLLGVATSSWPASRQHIEGFQLASRTNGIPWRAIVCDSNSVSVDHASFAAPLFGRRASVHCIRVHPAAEHGTIDDPSQRAGETYLCDFLCHVTLPGDLGGLVSVKALGCAVVGLLCHEYIHFDQHVSSSKSNA
ncbi:hypothetical protein F2P81_013031 [Scophthalmus maximus]|uniref:Uncharacterized protein n=1 Tax=Scophthalmus maximus TaxID=52904 RepID=A0A6A4SMI3_SCOMX|nr:hypothetical protein F2P81_013031 [Scophthalmus maximus]